MPIWAKVLKFSMSFGLYAVTLGWMLTQVQRPVWRRIGWWAGTGFVVVSLLEMMAITLQTVRGVQSHFNNGTPFDSQVFTAMGVLVGIIYSFTLVIAVALLVSPMRDRAFAWALRLGIVIAVAGLSVGFLMLQATPEQLALGDAATISGAHAVGVSDGGPALPVVGWSTTGGDLRIAHFIGMHALQAIPLLAVGLAMFASGRLTERTRLQIVLLGSLAYAGVFLLTLWQAQRGQPLLAPDTATLAALGALVAVTAVGAALVARAASAAGDEHPRPEVPA
jgi:uncharacterized membrane protein YhaH (DUF805 family)